MTDTGDVDFDNLVAVLEDWAIDHSWIVKHPEALAKDAAEYIFEELLGFERKDV